MLLKAFLVVYKFNEFIFVYGFKSSLLSDFIIGSHIFLNHCRKFCETALKLLHLLGLAKMEKKSWFWALHRLLVKKLLITFCDWCLEIDSIWIRWKSLLFNYINLSKMPLGSKWWWENGIWSVNRNLLIILFINLLLIGLNHRLVHCLFLCWCDHGCFLGNRYSFHLCWERNRICFFLATSDLRSILNLNIVILRVTLGLWILLHQDISVWLLVAKNEVSTKGLSEIYVEWIISVVLVFIIHPF